MKIREKFQILSKNRVTIFRAIFLGGERKTLPQTFLARRRRIFFGVYCPQKTKQKQKKIVKGYGACAQINKKNIVKILFAFSFFQIPADMFFENPFLQIF